MYNALNKIRDIDKAFLLLESIGVYLDDQMKAIIEMHQQIIHLAKLESVEFWIPFKGKFVVLKAVPYGMLLEYRK